MKLWSLLGAFMLIACPSKVVLHVKDDAATDAGGGSASGGETGSGGTLATAGTAGTGGTVGTGGAGAGNGAGGGTCTSTGDGQGWLFGSNVEGFTSYGTVTTELSWADQGCPDGGALELVIQFSGPDQEAAASVSMAPRDLSTGSPFTAWVRMPNGVGQGVAALFMKDAAGVYASGPTIPLFPGPDWFEVSGDLQAPSAYIGGGFDAAHVTEIGVQLNTPPPTPNQLQATTLFIDSIAQ